VRGPQKPIEGRYIIEDFIPATGEPQGEHAPKFVHQCGYHVRDKIPISIREWKMNKSAPENSYVSDVDKTNIWNALKQQFTLQTERYRDVIDPDVLEERVKSWALKKMATQFQTWKKQLYNKYIKQNKTPNFNEERGPIQKARPYWDDFVQYKLSEESEQRILRNKENAAKKRYHHRMGSGGYKTMEPKWEKMEADLMAKNIIPDTANWPERTKSWYFGVGGSLDPETGKLVPGEKLQEATERLRFILNAKESGIFRPNREKDELTYTIGTAEHGGRTRGKGSVPWLVGFPEDRETYKSRQRKKDEIAERFRVLETNVLETQEALVRSMEREKAMEARMQEEVKRQVQIALSAMKGVSSGPGVNISPPQQLKSSCASTELPIIQHDAPQHFPVDDVTEPLTPCELHIAEGDGSVMVATAVVSPIDRTRTPRIHNSVIPLGYAAVSVDRAKKEYRNLALQIEGGDGEKTLGEAEKAFILWPKRYIIIPSLAQPPPQRCG
jgi:hypothetical protein